MEHFSLDNVRYIDAGLYNLFCSLESLVYAHNKKKTVSRNAPQRLATFLQCSSVSQNEILIDIMKRR